MRKDDPGYMDVAGVGAEVFLGGEIVKQCLTADEDEGFVLVARLNESGKNFLDGDEVATEIKRGKVLIILPEKYEFLRRQ